MFKHPLELKKFYEIPRKYTLSRISDQVFRTANQISMEWLREKYNRLLNSIERQQLFDKLMEGMKLTFANLENILNNLHFE